MSSNADVSRTANLLNSSGEIVTSVENVVGSSLEKYTFNIPIKGTYYLTSASSGLNIYYAEITFSEVQYMSGDLNCDGLVNSHDMLLMKKGILSKSWSSNEIKATADVTGDGNVDSKDLSLLRKYLSGKNVEFALYKKPTPIEPVPKSAYEYDGFTFSGKVYLIGD